MELMMEIYVTGVVIANGIPDSDGDVLDKKDIKKIFTKYTIQQTDVQHNYIRNEGVDIIENWITRTPTIVGGKTVPSGSWLCTSKVANEDLIDLIFEGKLNSYSLGSAPKNAIFDDKLFIEKGLTYSEVADIEDVQPLFISFVDKGANGYTFEVMSYDTYINKNDKSEEKDMSNEQIEIPVEDEKISIGGLDKIREIFGINKSDDTVSTEPQQEVKIEPPKNETSDFNKEEFLSDIKKATSEGIAEGLKEVLKATQEVEKEEEEEEEVEEKEEEVKVDENKKINKRKTQKTDDIDMPQVETNFYKMSGRDAFGCKIRK